MPSMTASLFCRDFSRFSLEAEDLDEEEPEADDDDDDEDDDEELEREAWFKSRLISSISFWIFSMIFLGSCCPVGP